VSAPEDKDIEIELKHANPLFGGVTGKPASRLGGTTPSAGSD
jgi:hypothetical protein